MKPRNDWKNVTVTIIEERLSLRGVQVHLRRRKRYGRSEYRRKRKHRPFIPDAGRSKVVPRSEAKSWLGTLQLQRLVDEDRLRPLMDGTWREVKRWQRRAMGL